MEIKTFSEEYLEKQYEIGHQNLSTWLGARQTPVSRLRELYSKNDFNPETKFYAIENNEVVGFIPAKQTGDTSANLEFPLMANGYENSRDQLMQFAMDALREKGITKVITRASPLWGDTMDLTNKYDYRLKELMWKNAQLDVNSYVGRGTNGDITIDVSEADLPEIKQILIEFRENNEEEAQRQIDLLVRISQRVTSWKIMRKEGKIVGHDHLVEDISDSKRARMNAIYAETSGIRDSIMDAHVDAARASGIEKIDNFFWGPTENMDVPYKKYGFEISELYAYEKDL
jgi:hypothetical protein